MLLLLWLARFGSAKYLTGMRSGGRPLHQLLLRHSGAEYTPLARRCQQDIVVPNVLGAIECIGRRLPGFLTDYLPDVPVLESNSW